MPIESPTIVDSLSDEALTLRSSPKIFARGRTYAASGAVQVASEITKPNPTIEATVAGTQNYTTKVWIDDDELEGWCDCPNAQDGWFCKHQVAVALVWRQRISGESLTVDEDARKKVQASAKRAQTLRDREEALQVFLRSQPAPVLAEKLLSLAHDYREIERELLQWQKMHQAEPADLKSLVSGMLTPGRQFLDLREVHAYVHRAAAVLDVLQRERERDAASAVNLGRHALRRGWAALTQADDSNGEMGNLVGAIAREWVAAIEAAGDQPAAFGEKFLRLQLEDPFGCFEPLAMEKAMGPAALNRYRSALDAEWRQTKDAYLAKQAEQGPRRIRGEWSGRDETASRLFSLEHLLLVQLDQMGDIDGTLSVLRSDLSEPHRFTAVTHFLERHQRFREAFANAERACKVFPDDWRLQEDLLRCYERDGWTAEAYTLRRRQFKENPGVETFQAALRAGAEDGIDAGTLRQELLAEIETRETEDLRKIRRPMMRPSSQAASGQRNVSLRAQILCSEKRWDEAHSLIQPPAVCHPDILRLIALNLDEKRKEDSVKLLLRVFTHSMQTASTPYREELRLVKEIAARLDATRRTSWLQKLKIEFKAKRNFIRDLPAG